MLLNVMKRGNHMCKHINNEGILQFEINQKQGQEPVFTCRLCKEAFTQLDVNAIAGGLL